MSKEEFLICTRCGAKIRKTQRNCLKCGQLNFVNPDNEYMKKYVPKNSMKNVNNVNNSKVEKLSIYNNMRPNEVIAKNTGNLSIFIVTNILIFFLGLFIILSTKFDFSNKSFYIMVIGYIVTFLNFYSIQLLLMKANKPWWCAFVFLLICLIMYFVLQFNLKILIFIFLLISFIACYNVGVTFGKNPWLMILFVPIMLPVTAFSNTVSYNGIIYVIDTKKGNAIELLNKANKFILSSFLIIFLICMILIIFTFKDKIILLIRSSKEDKFIDDMVSITEKVKLSINSDDYVCSNGLSLKEQSRYYISFDNAASYFNIDNVDVSLFTGANYQGYVLVINPDKLDYVSYYISVDDTVYGISETNFDYIKTSRIEKNNFSVLPDNVVTCQKNRS